MMGEPIEKRARKSFRTEHRSPFIEWQVAGHESGALAEDLEEQFRTNRREWHVAQLIDDQQFDRVEVFLQRPQATYVARFHEFVHESGRRCKGDAVALLTSGKAEGQGNMSLAGAGWPKRNAVLASRSIRTAPAPAPAAY